MEIVGICSQEHVPTGTHGERTGQTRKKVTLKRDNDKGNKFMLVASTATLWLQDYATHSS
jgi:hypothetical protein